MNSYLSMCRTRIITRLYPIASHYLRYHAAQSSAKIFQVLELKYIMVEDLAT